MLPQHLQNTTANETAWGCAHTTANIQQEMKNKETNTSSLVSAQHYFHCCLKQISSWIRATTC